MCGNTSKLRKTEKIHIIIRGVETFLGIKINNNNNWTEIRSVLKVKIKKKVMLFSSFLKSQDIHYGKVVVTGYRSKNIGINMCLLLS